MTEQAFQRAAVNIAPDGGCTAQSHPEKVAQEVLREEDFPKVPPTSLNLSDEEYTELKAAFVGKPFWAQTVSDQQLLQAGMSWKESVVNAIFVAW